MNRASNDFALIYWLARLAKHQTLYRLCGICIRQSDHESTLVYLVYRNYKKPKAVSRS